MDFHADGGRLFSLLQRREPPGYFHLPDGKALTPPQYISIKAIAKDLYLCETDYGRGVMLNSKGELVE